ncbi:MAG TPA: AarF/ABC1/UbiB kinase family protein [Terriglobales bacterium]|nr:AarF/ABC1/UbiB kinase family protein [Terriglobales bacterium]
MTSAWKHLPAYRVLRVALATSRALPRYWWLFARDRFAAEPAPQSSWTAAHGAAAEQIHHLALTLEGGLIKAAQIGGARADILPRPFIDRLSRFHDDVPPRPFASLVPAVEDALGAPLASIFASVDPQPLGAASLAQVHRGRLHDGAEVVLKIQYPEARRIIPTDLRLLRQVAGLVHRMQRSLDLRSLVHEITRFIEMELDFRREAASAARLGAMLAGRGDVRVPHIYPEYTRDRVLVMEYLEGIQVTQSAALRAAGHSLGEIARRIGGLYGAMLFEYGFFHGDPHPGNLLVLPDGRIGLLDFGLCKELPADFARLVAQMMVAALIGDNAAALEAAAALSFDVESLRAEHLRALMLSILGDGDREVDLASILGAVRIRRIPDDFGLVLRTMLLLNGLSHRLAPGRRLLQGELIKHLAAGAKNGAAPQAREIG